MTNTTKWTVRNFDADALERLHEVADTSGIPIGHLLSVAVNEWYERLPEADDDAQREAPLRALAKVHVCAANSYR